MVNILVHGVYARPLPRAITDLEIRRAAVAWLPQDKPKSIDLGTAFPRHLGEWNRASERGR